MDHYYHEWENGQYLGVFRHPQPLTDQQVGELEAKGVTVRQTTDPRDRF